MIKIILGIILVVFGFFAFARYLESHSIFYPTRSIEVTPKDISLAFEDVYFTTVDNVKINGWLVKSPGARSTLLFFHGNAGNISHRLEKINLFRQIGVNVLIIDYRGYGKSKGRPTEEGMYKDALAAFDYLMARDDIDKDKIIAYGVSLGGVAAIDLATKRNIACLISESSIPSSADVCRVIYPFLPTFFLKTKMDSVLKVAELSMPKLFIHSINDEIIPFRLGKKLFDAAAEPKEFVQIIGGHNTGHIDSREKFIREISRFLRGLNLI